MRAELGFKILAAISILMTIVSIFLGLPNIIGLIVSTLMILWVINDNTKTRKYLLASQIIVFVVIVSFTLGFISFLCYFAHAANLEKDSEDLDYMRSYVRKYGSLILSVLILFVALQVYVVRVAHMFSRNKI